MPNIHIKDSSLDIVSQKLYESIHTVPEIAERLSLDLTAMYAILTGVKPLTFDLLIELAFYLDINLSELVETKHLAIEATVKFFDRAIQFDRELDYSYNKDQINDRLVSLIGFIEYEFARIAI